MGRNTVFFFKELWKNLVRNPLMSAAAASTTVLSLLTLGISLAIVYSINNLVVEVTSQVEIRAFLRKDVSNYKIKELQDQMMKLPQVRRVEYISSDRALDKLQEDLNLNLEMTPEENPLPPALVIRVADPRQVGVVADQIREMNGIEDMNYGETILKGILDASKIIKFVGYFLTILMAAAALFTIINTIRLTMIARKDEIRTMKLVGATTWFIRWPFMMEGIMLGLIGALISTIMISSGYMILTGRLQAALPFVFPVVENVVLTKKLFLILIASGIFMGLSGSYISMTRFLAENED